MSVKLPTNEQIEACLVLWEKLPAYEQPELVLRELFENRNNQQFNEVYCKVALLDSFYNTRVSREDLVRVTEWIVAHEATLSAKIDTGDPTAVWDLAANDQTDQILFSFATKFCSFSNPAHYPMYDSKVESLLWEYKKLGAFDQLLQDDPTLKSFRYELNATQMTEKRYLLFKRLIDELFLHCDLDEQYKYKGLDRFLWMPEEQEK